MRWPNLFLIGAPRCGTTLVNELLGAHPDIYMSPNKEPWFYALEGDDRPFGGPGDGQGVRDRAAYQALFADAGSAPVVGEASTLYMGSRRAPPAVRAEVPDAKIVAILRDPVERAFSNFTQHRWQGRETLGFKEALAAGPGRVDNGWAPFWDYRSMSRYGEQLARWYDAFPSEQIHVVVFEELTNDQDRVLDDLHRFLGLAASPRPEDRGPVNAAGQPKWALLHGFLRGSSRSKQVLRAVVPEFVRVPLRSEIDRRNRARAEGPSPAVVEELAGWYRDDLELARRLTGLALPDWLD